MTRLRPPSPARASRRLAALAVAVALASSAAGPALAGQGQVQSADADRARDLYKKGKLAYQAGDLKAAYAAFSAAWNLQRTYDIAANLAFSEVATSRFRDAAEHLTYALANLPVSGDADKQRPVLTKALAEAKKQIGTITIRVTVDQAAVTIDGHPVGTSPLPDEIFVDAGEHTVVATAPDHTPAEQKVRLEKGGASLISLTLTKPGPIRDVPKPQPSTGPRPLTIAGFVTAGLGLGAGTALAIVAKTKGDDASSKYDALKGMGAAACGGPSPSSACTALHDARVSHDTFANAALWTFIGAGVVTAGTLVYTFAVPRDAPAEKTTGGVSAAPIVTPGGGGLLVKGAF